MVKIKVVVDYFPDSGRAVARVKRTILNNAGDRVVSQAALSDSGQWVNYEPANLWPLEGGLDVEVRKLKV